MMEWTALTAGAFAFGCRRGDTWLLRSLLRRSFIHDFRKHGSAARRHQALEEINLVGIRSNKHACLVAHDAIHDDAGCGFGRGASQLLEPVPDFRLIFSKG